MLNAKCYDLHMITERLLAWVPMQKKAWSVPYHSYIHTLVLTQQSSGAGLPRKAWVDSPRWDVSTSPRSPIMLCYNTSRYQGAFPLFVCDSHSFSPLPRRRNRETKCNQPKINTLLQVSCAVYLCKKQLLEKQEEKQTNTSKLCRQ